MSLRLHSIVALLSLLAIAGCMSTNNNMVMQNSGASNPGRPNAPSAPRQNSQMQALIKTVASACMLPADQKGAYANPIFVNKLSVQPQPAQQNKTDGCASAKFKLNMDGTATQIVSMTEYPPNAGYADALQQQIRGSTFKPPIDANQWYYSLLAVVFNKNTQQ